MSRVVVQRISGRHEHHHGRAHAARPAAPPARSTDARPGGPIRGPSAARQAGAAARFAPRVCRLPPAAAAAAAATPPPLSPAGRRPGVAQAARGGRVRGERARRRAPPHAIHRAAVRTDTAPAALTLAPPPRPTRSPTALCCCSTFCCTSCCSPPSSSPARSSWCSGPACDGEYGRGATTQAAPQGCGAAAARMLLHAATGGRSLQLQRARRRRQLCGSCGRPPLPCRSLFEDKASA